MAITVYSRIHSQAQLCDYISLCIVLIASVNDIICTCQEREFGNVGARRGQQAAAVWERSYLTVGADGSQLCVCPGLWLTVGPGRDGEIEDGGREERRRRYSLALVNSLGGWGGGSSRGRGGLTRILWSLSRVGPDQHEASTGASHPGSDPVFLCEGMQPKALPRCQRLLPPRLPLLGWALPLSPLSYLICLHVSPHPHLKASISCSASLLFPPLLYVFSLRCHIFLI